MTRQSTTAKLLADAVHANKLTSKRGLLERLFTLAFSGLVYPQIWEDPEVDMAALDLGPGKRLITIASGGCNVMNYLTARPEAIHAVDLNPAHIALLELKLAAARHLPGHEPFFRFFGHADEKENTARYDRFLRDRLPDATRAYWEKRGLTGRRQISIFTRNIYRYGLLGRFIGLTHLIARAYGKNPRLMLTAEGLEDQRRLFEEHLAPVFDSRFVRWLCRMPVSLYGLGIPPAQYAALTADAHGDVAGLLRERLERLACDFPLEDNYFAWQAFGRGYDRRERRAVPLYLKRDNFETLRDTAGRVEARQMSMTDRLREMADESLDAYVLLDAQDWMTPAQMAELWTEIGRTAAPGARVIFRTAAPASPLERALTPDMLAMWRYDPTTVAGYVARDRSSIYGGFHLYVRNAA
jgi:S-adenosylmethionine-diacylglycerol 3-amino-3-carboxypropyl transferase